MKLRCLTALIGVILPVLTTPSQESLRRPDPFFLESGSSFSASSPSASKTKPITARPGADALVSDVEEAVAVIRGNYAGRKTHAGTQALDSSIRSMLKALDPHSNYFAPSEFAELLGEHRSEYSGSGSTIMNFKRDGRIETFVVAVTPGSPAAEGGLAFGDRIVAVNGKNTPGMSSLLVREMIRGPRGTDVSLTVERAATGAVETIRIRRDRLTHPTVPHAFVIDNSVGYIDMTVGFSYTTVTEFETSLAKLKAKGITSLVLDLRGNGGGIVDQAVAVAEKFLPRGRSIVSQRGRNPYEDRNWRSVNPQPETMPLVLLVDSHTASAAEIVAGAFQDNDRAMIVGSRTFGKGLVQNVLELESGAGLTLTAARYYTPSGRSIQRDYSDASLYEYFANTERAAMVDRSAFVARTLTERRVYGGDGIAPDIEVPVEAIDPVRASLVDKIFFFTCDLMEGRIEGAPARPEIRRSITFGEDPLTDSILREFLSIYGPGSAQNNELDAFVRTQLRYFISLAALGTAEANKALIEHDPVMRKAIENISAAAKLAERAAAVTR